MLRPGDADNLNSALTESSGLDAPTIQKRSLQSVIAVHNDDTIVLGGLINDRDNTITTAVPILRDIPLLGPLFRSDTINNRRTELLVLITPRVVHDRRRARKLTEELRLKLSSFNKLVPDEH